jgi:hypothetical protein
MVVVVVVVVVEVVVVVFLEQSINYRELKILGVKKMDTYQRLLVTYSLL